MASPSPEKLPRSDPRVVIITKRNDLPDNLRKLPRVTSILKNIAQPELEAWKLRVGLEEAKRISKESSKHGNAIHAAARYYAKRGFKGVKDIEDRPLRRTVIALRDWVEENVAVVHHCERRIHNTFNGYRGTADVVWTLRRGNRKTVFDYKCGNRIYDEHRMQVSAYRFSDEFVDDPAMWGAGILHLEQDNLGMPYWTPTLIPDDELRLHFRSFLCVLDFHRYRAWRKRVKYIYSGDDDE